LTTPTGKKTERLGDAPIAPKFRELAGALDEQCNGAVTLPHKRLIPRMRQVGSVLLIF
jgi:hypothetical protein